VDDIEALIRTIEKDFCDTAEATQLIGTLSPQALGKRTRKGKIGAVQIFGVWLYQRSDIQAEAERQKERRERLDAEHAEELRTRAILSNWRDKCGKV
jgi:hypothetical protein